MRKGRHAKPQRRWPCRCPAPIASGATRRARICERAPRTGAQVVGALARATRTASQLARRQVLDAQQRHDFDPLAIHDVVARVSARELRAAGHSVAAMSAKGVPQRIHVPTSVRRSRPARAHELLVLPDAFVDGDAGQARIALFQQLAARQIRERRHDCGQLALHAARIASGATRTVRFHRKFPESMNCCARFASVLDESSDVQHGFLRASRGTLRPRCSQARSGSRGNHAKVTKAPLRCFGETGAQDSAQAVTGGSRGRRAALLAATPCRAANLKRRQASTVP